MITTPTRPRRFVAALGLVLAVTISASPAALGQSAGPAPSDWTTTVCTAYARVQETRGPLEALGQAARAGDLDAMAVAAITAGLLGDQALRALESIAEPWGPGAALASYLASGAYALVDVGLALSEASTDDPSTFLDGLGSVIAAYDGMARATEELALLRASDGIDCAAIPVPSAAPLPLPSGAPIPVDPGAGADPELEARFPDAVDGIPVEPVSRSGIDLLAASDPEDPAVRALLEDLLAFLEARGHTIDDLSLAFAFLGGDEGIVSITAYRVRGADAAALEEGLLPLITLSYEDVQRETVTIDGRELTRISQGPYDPEGIFEVLVPSGDTLWAISATGETLEQLVAAFPG